MRHQVAGNELVSVWAGDGEFIRIEHGSESICLTPPSVCLRDVGIVNEFAFLGAEHVRTCNNGGEEYALRYDGLNGRLGLTVVLRVFPDSPVVRFQYVLSSAKGDTLDKPDGVDAFTYFGLSMADDVVMTEVQFAQFLPHMHCFTPVYAPLSADRFSSADVPGPILLMQGRSHTALVAYEHGAEYPDSYLCYSQSDDNALILRARRGNYYRGQPIGPDSPFQSCWFQVALIQGDQAALLERYRRFFLTDICEYPASRKPYIFYNTWNYQEKDHNLNNLPYLENMREDRILSEIEVASRMGIDVFVIDTGWYEKTGDWIVDKRRFPDGMRRIKALLDSHGMKLGLWFNPIVAARTSRVATNHPEYRSTWDGKCEYHPIWETEESCQMCLCSGYSDLFAEEMIRLYCELGVSYFKWDGIGQYGCNSELHNHGTADNAPEERAECYSYGMGLEMIRMVEKLSEACPDAIVDFDVTEAGRFMGLGFLAVGKYFLINNGPYAQDFDLPERFKYQHDEPVTLNPWTNIFFYPGAARPRFCRQGILYDDIVPSILLLTHYLPEGNARQMENSFASLTLGGNGIWGSLSDLSEDEVMFWKTHLAEYKQVRDAAMQSTTRHQGIIGASPEIYEKIHYAECRGMIAFFARKEGEYCWSTRAFSEPNLRVSGADRHVRTPDGRLLIHVNLPKDGARVVFIQPADDEVE